MTTWQGKCSWFGGPNDMGVSPDEGLAFIYSVEDAPHLFLPQQPPGTTGLARRLDPDIHYIACRWDYSQTPKEELPYMVVTVRALETGETRKAFPADWGPHQDTNRIADLSPGLMTSLGIDTDDEVEVTFDAREVRPMTYGAIAISSGHGLHVRGASGVLDEVDEARNIVSQLAEELKLRGVTVMTFNDDVSTTQSENLDRIVDWHNAQDRDLDISVHLNAYVETIEPMGTEVLYVTQDELANTLADAMASCGFIDRGGKFRDDLAFLNGTAKPSVLLEVCFCDSEADAEIYNQQFNSIVSEIADVLGGEAASTPPELERRRRISRRRRFDLQISGDSVLVVNGRVMEPVSRRR